jgi:polyphosphate kinase
MGRNLFKRIEVAFPVRDPEQKRRVIDEGLFCYLTDNRDAWELQPDGRWIKVVPRRGARVRSAQAELLEKLRGVKSDVNQVATETTRAPQRRARATKGSN